MIKISNANTNNLKNISLEIPSNKFVCFVGKSGSGKSTLAVNVIYSGYYHKTDNVKIDIKPLLFSQKVTIPKGSETVGDYLLTNKDQTINQNLLSEIAKLLKVDNINLDQNISTLSLNTYNKIRFIRYLNTITDEKLLIIDELGSGFCYEEAINIFKIYQLLIKSGFSIIAVEHSAPLIINSDYIVELGPDAGIHGGNIMFSGDTKTYLTTDSSFVKYINEPKEYNFNSIADKNIVFKNVSYLNYTDLDFKIPLNCLVTIIGESGSGKTTLLNIIQKLTNKAPNSWKDRQDIIYDDVTGKNYIRRPHIVDQSPLSSISTSIPLTYIGLMEPLRALYASNFKLPIGYFSFNGKGKCLNCNGNGYLTEKLNNEIITNECPICNGKRYQDTILEKKINDYSIGDLLKKTVEENIFNFEKIGVSNYKLKFLSNIGLSYLSVGQPSATLSGGECQRIKIAKELAKKLGDRSIYILDNPTRGLHVSDIGKLWDTFELLKSKNNSVVVADNNPDLIMKSDWVIYVENSVIIYYGRPTDIPVHIKSKMGLV